MANATTDTTVQIISISINGFTKSLCLWCPTQILNPSSIPIAINIVETNAVFTFVNIANGANNSTDVMIYAAPVANPAIFALRTLSVLVAR